MYRFEDGCYGSAKGIALIGKVLAGRCKMHYTRVAAGKGTITEGLTPKTLEEPPEYVMDAMIASVTNPVDGECQVSVQINSAYVEKGFYVKWLILYAEDPDEGEVPFTALCLENEPEWIRPASSIVGKLAHFDMIAAVGDVDKVSATIDPDAIATYAAVKQLIAEATAPSGTGAPTEDTPGVVGGRYFDVAAKQEYICVEVTPDGKSVWQASGGASDIITMDITVPSDGWEYGDGEDDGEPAGLRVDIPDERIRADMVPHLDIHPAHLDAARSCVLSAVPRTLDGALRLYAQYAPAADMTATLTLFCATSGAIAGGSSGGTGYSLPAATAHTLGAVKPGAGLRIEEDGTLYVDTASDAEINQMLAETLASENK